MARRRFVGHTIWNLDILADSYSHSRSQDLQLLATPRTSAHRAFKRYIDEAYHRKQKEKEKKRKSCRDSDMAEVSSSASVKVCHNVCPLKKVVKKASSA